MKQKLQADKTVKILIYLVSLSILLFYGTKLTLPIVLDDTGTMSNAAYLAGYDWSVINDAMGNYYYKYFQALLYVPLFLWVRNPFVRYQGIMAIHAVIMSLIPVIVYELSRRFLKVDKKRAAAFALCVGTLPSVILYSQYARADMMMCSLPWFTLFVLMVCQEAIEEGKKKKAVGFSVLAAFFPAAAYMSHTRGIVLIIATVMVVYLFRFFYKKKMVRAVPFWGTLAGLLIADIFLSAYFKARLWPEGAGHASVEAFDFRSLLLLFTPAGIKSMVKLIIGWMFNAFTSTYGMAAVGFVVCILVLIYNIRKSKSITMEEQVITGFSLLWLLGSAALGLLFMFKPTYDIFTGATLDRSDRMIYGRYIVNAFGMMTLIAMYTLFCRKEWLNWKSRLGIIVLHGGVVGIFCWKIAGVMEGTNMTSRNILSLCTFLELNKPGGTTGTFKNLPQNMRQVGLVGFLVFLVLMLLSVIKKRGALLIGVFVLVNILNFNICYSKIRYGREKQERPGIEAVFDCFADIRDLDEKYRNVYIGEALEEQYFQMPLTEFRIYNSSVSGAEDVENMFLIFRKNKPDFDIKGYYFFNMFEHKSKPYYIYVRGEELVQELRSRGVELLELDGQKLKYQKKAEK